MGGDIPIVREQCYMLSPLSYFRVAGILPDGRVSGRFYCPMLRFCTWLVLDASRSSQARGSGFDTLVAVSDLRGPGVHRAITCLGRGKYFWTVLHILEPKRLAPPPSLPARPIIPPLPPCLLSVVAFLREQNITPVLMSSDASFEYAVGPPSSVFKNTELAVANCTACIMVADSSFPRSGPPAAAVIIHGIERIRHGTHLLESWLVAQACITSARFFRLPLCPSRQIWIVGRSRPFRSTFLRIRYRLSIGFMVRCYVPSSKEGETTLEFVIDTPIRSASTRLLLTVRRVLLFFAPSGPRATGSITWLTGTRAQILWRLHLSNLGCSPGGSFISRLRILNQVMSPDSLVWVSQDMPTVNPVCSIPPPLLGARAYLAQRDSCALTRSALTRYNPEGYWFQVPELPRAPPVSS
jgi:hypothetical protein